MCECLWVSTPTVTLAGTSAILSAAIGLLCWMDWWSAAGRADTTAMGLYQTPIRSLLARRRLLAVVADTKATDQNKGTKPVFKGVNPVPATTARIFAVFKIDDSSRRSLSADHSRVTISWGTVQTKGLRRWLSSADLNSLGSKR